MKVTVLVAETGVTLVVTHSLLFPMLTPPARGSYADVEQAVAAVRMTEALLGWREPANPRHNV